MKTIFSRSLCVILVMLFWTCSDVEFNDPAFQADRNNELWRAISFKAEVEPDGAFVISGTNNLETIRLVLPNNIEGNYTVGDEGSAYAEYIDAFDTVFSTANPPDPSVSIYPEIGSVRITQSASDLFTGEFNFIAFDSEGLNPVGFSNGIFFEVPQRATVE